MDLKLSKGLLDSVTNVLKDSSKVKAEQAKATNEQLAARYKAMPKPTSMEDAKVASYAAKAPERRLNDAIAAVYTKSVSEHAARAKQEADAIKNAYAARGGVKPVVEEVTEAALTPKQKKIDINKNKTIDAFDLKTLRDRRTAAQTGDVSDETILDGEAIVEKEGTIPKTPREKDLAAKAHPKDKITHKDVMVARGVVAKEEKDTPGNGYEHQCAIHVKHAKLGEGRTLFSQHAEPDEEGNIAWYDVMFAEGIEKKVPTTDLEILVSESHMNHKKKKM